MVVGKEMRDPLGASLEVARGYREMLETQRSRIEALEAALREIAERSWHPANAPMGDIARAALTPEQDK